MALHLIKLCVGATSIADLEQWIAGRAEAARKAGQPFEQVHVTRMAPTRRDELLAGGSLYWVIHGEVAARQRLLDLRPVTGADGVHRCALVLDPAVIPVVPRPSRPFQGWRYLAAADAPQDLAREETAGDLPETLRRELRDLGLL